MHYQGTASGSVVHVVRKRRHHDPIILAANLKVQCAGAVPRGMSDQQLRKEAHDLDVTVWVGKGGIEAVTEELKDQLQDRKLVKVKFLRAARGGTTTDELAAELGEAVGADLIETRGNTAVFH